MIDWPRVVCYGRRPDLEQFVAIGWLRRDPKALFVAILAPADSARSVWGGTVWRVLFCFPAAL